ncbi:MAG: hypothetical protein R3B55_01660 [Candidatus Paceibacterota bacterium]
MKICEEKVSSWRCLQPEVIIKDIDGVKSEPFEEATIVVPEEFSGAVIEKMGKRKGLVQEVWKTTARMSKWFSLFLHVDFWDIEMNS